MSAGMTLWTLNGSRLNLENPDHRHIDAFDLAHALARECRFANQCADHYSVAQHSLLVERIARQRGVTSRHGRMWALLHDAHEAYTRDIPQPLKLLLAPLLKPIEARLDAAIKLRFAIRDLPGSELELIHQADLIALATEKRCLGVDPLTTWPILEGIAPAQERIDPLPVRDAQVQWLGTFLRLYMADPA